MPLIVDRRREALCQAHLTVHTPEQDGMAGKAKDKIRPAVGGDPSDDLGGGKMTLAADQNRGVGPVAPQRRQPPPQEQGIFGSSRARARTQEGRDAGRRCAFEPEER